ncbi:hypothetical protein BDQ17DRAFT_860821 [Cyathus striatus]|nr:hypothetical protein BDQ17DRAFT_860821 [Cyathus striatus]
MGIEHRLELNLTTRLEPRPLLSRLQGEPLIMPEMTINLPLVSRLSLSLKERLEIRAQKTIPGTIAVFSNMSWSPSSTTSLKSTERAHIHEQSPLLSLDASSHTSSLVMDRQRPTHLHPTSERLMNTEGERLSLESMDSQHWGTLRRNEQWTSSRGDFQEKESSKRQRIYLQDMPFYNDGVQKTRVLHPEVIATPETLKMFSNDVGAVCRWTLQSSTVSDFPESEWDNIIRGKQVNLGIISAARNAPSQIGDLEPSSSSSQLPAPRVFNEGQWFTAWQYTIDAILHLFPHRRNELLEYGRYITEFFDNMHDSQEIIAFDQACRNHVSSRSDLRLCDFNNFRHLEFSYLSCGGKHYSLGDNKTQSSSKASATRDKSREVCRKFNSSAGCGFRGDQCKYIHKCFKCDKPGHGMASCKSGEPGK